jgi:hypothetical protein
VCHIFSCSSWPFAPPIMPVGCPGRGHRANSQSRSPPETGERHHTSVRNPRPTLGGWAGLHPMTSADHVTPLPGGGQRIGTDSVLARPRLSADVGTISRVQTTLPRSGQRSDWHRAEPLITFVRPAVHEGMAVSLAACETTRTTGPLCVQVANLGPPLGRHEYGAAEFQFAF